MKQCILMSVLLLVAGLSIGQPSFPKQMLTLNAFRNPSMGVEYQHNRISLHGGYYFTNFKSGVTTEFLKAGVSYWFLAVDKKPVPSSFYAGASYLRGLTKDFKDLDAVGVEAGFRWYVWKGLHVRAGLIGITAKGQRLKVNPTPGISYSFRF